MAVMVLIAWPETAWSAVGRLAGRTPIPLTAEGRGLALSWAESLREVAVGTVFASAEQASVETSKIMAEHWAARQKTVADLSELDVGLWEGLTPEELGRRYPKVYKRWLSEPLSVCSPEGEDPRVAQARLMKALHHVLGRKQSAAVVVGPLAYGLTRMMLEEGSVSNCRRHVPVVYTVDVDSDGDSGGDSDGVALKVTDRRELDVPVAGALSVENNVGDCLDGRLSSDAGRVVAGRTGSGGHEVDGV